MPQLKVLLPDSIKLNPALPDGATAVTYAAMEPVPEEHRDADVLVVWGNRWRDLRQTAPSFTNLKLVQALMAGPDALLTMDFSPSVTMCNGVGLHDQTVSEHALAMLLTMVRRLPASAEAQRDHRWANELGGNQELHPDGPVTTLLGARVLIWGFGSIGTTLAPMLRGLGATVTGVARSAGERKGFPVITDDTLADELGRTDALIMILPAGDDTADALNAERLGQLKQGAYVVNVGRGNSVDEAALLEALQSGQLGGAALDVFKKEPLPEDSPLWDAPNVLITPHGAGGRPVEADELIERNVAALIEGGELRNVFREGA